MKIVIHKSQRTLECVRDGGVLFSARVQLGFAAEGGAKSREGDGKTPEGTYAVCSRNPESRFHRALGISYPNPRDALRGLREGALSPADFARICASPARPPWDTPLGGFIMIHGQPNEGAREGDWTAGCAALPDADMDALWEIAEIGDEVEILP